MTPSQTTFPDLQGKAILVTGANRGIGLGIARELANQKAHIIFHHRKSTEQTKERVEELKSAGAQVTPIEFDLEDPSAIETQLKALIKSGVVPTGVVNNAGLATDQLLLRLKLSDMDKLFQVNLKAAIQISSILARGLLKGNSSSVVNISSVVGAHGNPGQVIYAASKAGLLGVTKSMALEFGAKNIRVNAVLPGFIDTDMTGNMSEEAVENYRSKIPLKRFGNPSDVAKLVVFLLSDYSQYITGECIQVSGGLMI